jgi:hypothetical protein
VYVYRVSVTRRKLNAFIRSDTGIKLHIAVVVIIHRTTVWT